MFLHNRIGREELKKRRYSEDFIRKTLSFYRYFNIESPEDYRNELYRKWFKLSCFGRIYVAREGINAQMSVPEPDHQAFLASLESTPGLENIPVKYALEDDGKSFYKLTIKVRNKIVADGLDDGTYDVSNVGNHLTAKEFHKLMYEPDTIVVDMRNHYEYEVGHFKNAVTTNANTFREAIRNAVDQLSDRKDRRILLYCTGGIRCEKASAFLKHHGFTNVNQLYGGIIEYARQIKKLDLESGFTGKNFVFDDRLGESVDGNVIARCHQCGKPCDRHTNCANDDCHRLFIQCDECRTEFKGCCSGDCRYILTLPKEERSRYRILWHHRYSKSKIYSKVRYCHQTPSMSCLP